MSHSHGSVASSLTMFIGTSLLALAPLSAQEGHGTPGPPYPMDGVVQPAGPEATQDQASPGHHPILAPVVDLGRAIRSFGYDSWRVVSAPARLDRESALKLGAFVVAGGLLFVNDEEVSKWLRENSTPGSLIRDVGDELEPFALQGNTNAILAGLALVGYATRQHWLQAPAKQLLYSQWIGGIIRQASGQLAGRKRPFDAADPYQFDPGEGKSFPSGHSAVAMEVATVLSHHIGYRPASVLLYGAAATVVLQRVSSGAHWASDAWVGAGLGFATARIVVETEESGKFSLQPTVGPGGGMGIAAAIRF